MSEHPMYVMALDAGLYAHVWRKRDEDEAAALHDAVWPSPARLPGDHTGA